MTVKELINKLLDQDMDKEVVIYTGDEEFEIVEVDEFGVSFNRRVGIMSDQG